MGTATDSAGGYARLPVSQLRASPILPVNLFVNWLVESEYHQILPVYLPAGEGFRYGFEWRRVSVTGRIGVASARPILRRTYPPVESEMVLHYFSSLLCSQP
jgi:hypothetical protein